MNVPVKHILRPWYFTAFSTFLAIFVTVFSVIIISSLRDDLLDNRKYFDKIEEDIIVTERDNQLKTMAMYNLIVSTYGNKYSKKYNHGKKRRYQGLEVRWQLPLFNRTCYEYENRLGIPHMVFHTFAKIETAFNPLAETRKKLVIRGDVVVGIKFDEKYFFTFKGKKEKLEDDDIIREIVLEAGIFQHREEAVGQALIFHRQMYAINPKLAQELEFKFTKMPDLFDPMNALKVQAVLVWGYMQRTANQMAWWTTLTHWGWGRISGYYFFRKNGGILPDDFTFNKNTIKEDVRDPLQYFGLFYANWGQFSQFKIKVGVEQWYDERYREECSALEWQFIQSWKYVKELKHSVEDIREFELEVKTQHEKKLNKILKLSKEIDLEYLKLNNAIKAGKFAHINDILIMWKKHFKVLIRDLSSDEPTTKVKVGKREVKFSKGVIIFYLITVAFVMLWAMFGFVMFVRAIVKWIVKKRSIKIDAFIKYSG